MWTLIVWYTLIAITTNGTFKEPGRAVYHTPDKGVCLKWQADALSLANSGAIPIVVQPCKQE